MYLKKCIYTGVCKQLRWLHAVQLYMASTAFLLCICQQCCFDSLVHVRFAVINLFFVFSKGAAKTLEWPSSKSAWVSAVIAGGMSLLSAAVIIPYMKYQLSKQVRE